MGSSLSNMTASLVKVQVHLSVDPRGSVGAKKLMRTEDDAALELCSGAQICNGASGWKADPLLSAVPHVGGECGLVT